MPASRSIRTVLQLDNVTGATSVTHASPGVAGDAHDAAQLRDLVAELVATETVGGGTLDATIEDSFDDGTSWNTWVSFTQLSASGRQVIAPTRPPGGLVRSRGLVPTAGTWAYRVKLSGNQLR